MAVLAAFIDDVLMIYTRSVLVGNAVIRPAVAFDIYPGDKGLVLRQHRGGEQDFRNDELIVVKQPVIIKAKIAEGKKANA